MNTCGNILALNFEPICWNYSLGDDKVPPLVQYGHFRDAPVRPQPHPVVRAQRLRLAGSGDARVLRTEVRAADLTRAGLVDMQDGRWTSMSQLQPGRAPSGRQRSAGPSVTLQEPAEEAQEEGEEGQSPQEAEESPKAEREPSRGRRLSWAFERPTIPPTEVPDVAAMKALLKGQLRSAPEAAQKAEFISLTVAALQDGFPAREESQRLRSLALVLQGLDAAGRRRARPNSSPSRVDPRTKVSAEESNWRALLTEPRRAEEEEDEEEEKEEEEEEKEEEKGQACTPRRRVFTTAYVEVPLRPSSGQAAASRHSKSTRTTIPRSRHLRPHSAAPAGPSRPAPPRPAQRPRSALPLNLRRPASATSQGGQSFSSTAEPPPVITPMLMYPKGMLDGLERRKAALAQRLKALAAQNSANPFKDPFRANTDLKLRTYEQDMAHMRGVECAFEARRAEEAAKEERGRKQRWLRMASARKQRPKTAS